MAYVRQLQSNAGNEGEMCHSTVAHSALELMPSLEDTMREHFPTLFIMPTGMPPKRPFDMRIRLALGATPPYSNPYRVTPLEDAGNVTTDLAPARQPLDNRFNVTFRSTHPIRKEARRFADQGPGSTQFTRLDLKSGYHYMQLQPKDREKTVFKTKYGLFEWTVVLFGLANVLSAFICTMAKLLHRHRAYCIVYLDNMLIHTQGTKSAHHNAVTVVLATGYEQLA